MSARVRLVERWRGGGDFWAGVEEGEAEKARLGCSSALLDPLLEVVVAERKGCRRGHLRRRPLTVLLTMRLTAHLLQPPGAATRLHHTPLSYKAAHQRLTARAGPLVDDNGNEGNEAKAAGRWVW